MKTKIFSMFDYFLIILVSLLVFFGILFIYSSNIDSEGILNSNEHIKQIIWAFISFFVMVIFTIYDYRKYENFSKFLYLFGIFLLILVLIPKIGINVNGARSWLGTKSIRFQPAELVKILYTLYLAKYLNDSREENPLKRTFFAILIMGVPVCLILLQSDLGSASVYIAIFFIMCFFAGIPLKILFYLLSVGLLSIVFACLPLWNSNIAKNPTKFISLLTITKYRFILIVLILLIIVILFILKTYFHKSKTLFYLSFLLTTFLPLAVICFLLFYFKLNLKKFALIFSIIYCLLEFFLLKFVFKIHSVYSYVKKYINIKIYIFSILFFSLIFSFILLKVLKNHQIWRLIIFMNPYVSEKKYGWNIIQSQIAIGAGGLFGKSYLHGVQSHLKFLPERSTDFIFSILAEEWGFLGGFLVFTIYLAILLRILFIIKNTNNSYGVYVASGILSIYAYHFFINIGTVMGITPVIGIPMLFMSYGGSSLMTSMLSLGIVMSINYRRSELN